MKPLWATPERQALLVKLFTKFQGFCVYGEGPACPKPVEHCYEVASENIITFWKEDDREARSYEWKLEEHKLYDLRRLWKRGQFGTLERAEYLANRPVWRILAFGISAFTMHRVAKVEIPDLRKVLWVDISGAKASKNSVKKAARYGGQVPKQLMDYINAKVDDEVRRYLKG